MDGEALSEFAKTAPFRDAEFGGKELVRGATHMIKVLRLSLNALSLC